MKIAVAKEGKFVSGHFGHCEGFEIFDVQEGKIQNRALIPNPGHKPGFLPPYLAEKGIQVIIAGGMGATAVELFNNHNVSVVVGAEGEIDEVIQKYIKGELKSTGSICEEHMHEGHCND
jgi:predicted Fe-Mo cluster-binding NifX family protein